jgi:hypothetical protein
MKHEGLQIVILVRGSVDAMTAIVTLQFMVTNGLVHKLISLSCSLNYCSLHLLV